MQVVRPTGNRGVQFSDERTATQRREKPCRTTSRRAADHPIRRSCVFRASAASQSTTPLSRIRQVALSISRVRQLFPKSGTKTMEPVVRSSFPWALVVAAMRVPPGGEFRMTVPRPTRAMAPNSRQIARARRLSRLCDPRLVRRFDLPSTGIVSADVAVAFCRRPQPTCQRLRGSDHGPITICRNRPEALGSAANPVLRANDDIVARTLA